MYKSNKKIINKDKKINKKKNINKFLINFFIN